jgi:hypothetical protein
MGHVARRGGEREYVIGRKAAGIGKTAKTTKT